MTALEAGYRGDPTSWLSLSVNLFYNFYNDLRTTEFLNGADAFPSSSSNGRKGRSYGIEAWGKAQALPWWRLSLGATTLHKNSHVVDSRIDLQPRNSLGADPHWQVVGSSDMDLTSKIRLTFDVRGVGVRSTSRLKSPAMSKQAGELAYDLD